MNGELVHPQQVLIECKIIPTSNVTTAVNPFDEQDFLINRPIIAIQAFCASDMPKSPLSSRLNVIPDSLLPYAFLNINRSGQAGIKAGVWYKNLPLCSLRHVWNNSIGVPGNLDMFRCDPMYIQWRDTNISFPNSRSQDQDFSVPLLITYLLPEQDFNQYRMAYIKGQRPAIKGIDF